MRQITVKIGERERNYIDKLIDQGKFASYGHSFRALLHYYKVMGRENAKLRTENARFRERLELFENGKLQKAETPGNLANG